MSKNLKRILIAGAVLVAAGAGGAVAVQAGSGDDESPRAPEADRAGAAAVKIAGGGSAASVERDAEGNRVWEVEVAKPDGTTLEVDLDAALEQVAAEPDDAEQPASATTATTTTTTTTPTTTTDRRAPADGRRAGRDVHPVLIWALKDSHPCGF